MGIDIINSPFIHNINLGIYIDINLLFKNIMLKTNVCLKIRENSGRQTIEPCTDHAFFHNQGCKRILFLCSGSKRPIFGKFNIKMQKCPGVEGDP